ncbi:hypothetical protein O6H91_16G046500 [Diphasiastrum complanatum]|uniref:Uncharacterized protein n=1 Tax=Diphasiastrum complanatum TaxID=34168 RepID=A0ACC2BCY3_DIPCM|nr:hypothetical protein O6H91_16G046500 [Diphasiastrum complanatum]
MHAYGMMDRFIWSNLPQDILVRVLVFLPLKSLLRLRCVCKRWNYLVDLPRFVTIRAEIAYQDPWLLMFKRQDYRVCRAFDESSRKWHRLALSFLPCKVTDAIATAAGLLCFGTEDPAILIVCNPLTKNWKVLPPMRCEGSRGVIGLMVDRKMNTYSIIAARHFSHEYDMKTEVYDSRQNNWKVTGDLPPKTLLRRDTVYWNGVLYLLTAEPFTLLAYDFAKGTWSKVPASLPGSLTFSSLIVSHNVLFLAGGIGRNGISKFICIWRLEVARMEWKEVHRMPDMICKRFLALCYHNYEHISCVGQADLIYISCYTWPEAVVYRASQRSWRSVPRCPELPTRSSFGFNWFHFDPNYDVSV